MSKLAPKRIAIVGAGPAGLMAARILQRNGCDVTVFEGEASTDARDQGGTLDLHPDSGLAALSQAGLLDQFKAVARYEDQESRLLDHATAEPLFEEIPAPGEGDRPEIDRRVLRDMLLDSLEPGTVRWSSKLAAVGSEVIDGCHALLFVDGGSERYDLVIGADGAWSKVRAALTDVKPTYTGVTFVELWLDDADERHREIAQLVGHGTMFSFHDGAGLVAQRNGGGHIRVYAALKASIEELELAGIANGSTRIRSALLRRFASWSPRLLAMIMEGENTPVVRPIVALPPGCGWASKPGLTIIGDAAHVMPPVGVGVNLAMLDAADLATALSQDADWHRVVPAFENAMLDRAAAEAVEASEGFADMFAADAPRGMLAHMQLRRWPEPDA